MRAFSNRGGINRVGIAVASLSICALLLARLPLSPWPMQAAAQTPAAAPKAKEAKPPRIKLPAAKNAPGVAAPAQTKPARPPFSLEDEAEALVLGLPDARAWGDSEEEFARLLPKVDGPWLALSGGGSDGAYAAGLLTGLTPTGKRPDFAVVTGASIGALIAPYAFLGPRYDEDLHNQFSTITAGDIFEDRPTGDSLMDSWPLGRTIDKRVTPQLLADIAAEHARGRRLFVVTTNLDAGRRVIWNMGAIAARGDEAALKLFRAVLLASASIPGIFPPVLIEAQSHGKTVQELHNDGTLFHRAGTRARRHRHGPPDHQADLCDREREAHAAVRRDDDANHLGARALDLAGPAIRTAHRASADARGGAEAGNNPQCRPDRA
jgi:hypothetical protein